MNEAEKQLKANQLAGYERTSAVIWMIISILQIISVVFILAGIWNLIASLSSFDTEKKILNRDADVPNIFQDITQLIIIGFINIVFGGLLGIALVGFDFWIRSEVLANKDIFDNQNGDKKQVGGNSVGVSCYEELEQIYQLKSKGILTEEEFNQEKARLLSK